MSNKGHTDTRKGVEALPAIVGLADSYALSAAAFVFTFKAVAMPAGHSDAEFVSCCLVAKEHGLNPLTKEIYFMKTKSGSIQPIVSVDGWVRKLNEHPQFDGMQFSEQNDGNGNVVSMTCTIYRRDRKHPTIVTEYLDDCSKSGGPVWKINPRRMLRHRVLTQCARYAIGFAGVMDRDEFDQWQAMRDVTPKPAPAALELPDIPDEAPEPASDQQAVLREIERALQHMTPEGVHDQFKTAIMAMDESGREEAIEMIQAAKGD